MSNFFNKKKPKFQQKISNEVE